MNAKMSAKPKRPSLKARGFDKCHKSTETFGATVVGCSQCQALVINGVACHESGCPNENKGRSRYLAGCGKFDE